MTEKFELVDKLKVVDAFEPDKLLAIVVEPDFGKKLIKALNAAQTNSDSLAKLTEELSAEKAKVAKLEARLAKIALLISTEDIDTVDVTEAKKTKKREIHYKERRCIGYGHQGPHMFIPTAGNQSMCPACKEAMKRERGTKEGRIHMDRMGTKTEYRGTIPPGVNRAEVIRQPTIEEVLDMTDVEERAKWEAKWSESERKQAQIIKNKRAMAEIKRVRDQGKFSLNDPIMGARAPSIK